MTGEEVVKLEEQFEKFKQTCVHPALFWANKMSEAILDIEYNSGCFDNVYEYIEKAVYYESRYTDVLAGK